MFGQSASHGISKKQAEKRNYFDIFGRHFGHICGASFWYALSNILFFGGAYYLFSAYFGGENLITYINAFLAGKPFLVPFIPFIPLMFIGPFTAGFTYVIRNYAKQEHTFLISDFFSNAKRNLKQALCTSVIFTLAAYLLIQALVFYNHFFLANGIPLGVLYTLIGVVAILLIIMSFYVYPMMVTFRMDLKIIFKNAWVFTIMKLPQNLIIFAFLFSVNAGLLYLFLFVFPLFEVWIVLFVFFLTGFTSFTANYYIWHVLDKHIVQLVTKQREEERIFVDEEHMEDADDLEENYDEYI